MSVETRPGAINDGMVVDNYSIKTAAATLNIREQRVDCDSTLGAFTVTLPPVGLAEGKFFGIYLTVDGGDITIQDQDDSIGWDGDYTLDDVGDGYLFYSDGKSWWPIGALA